MKLIVRLIIVCVLFNKVYSLQCYQCLGLPCNPEEKNCPPAQKCGSIAVLPFKGEQSTLLWYERRCVEAKERISGSVNLGFNRTGINTTDCSADLCNAETNYEYSKHSFNGKKCYTCSENDCTSTLRCRGDENSCVKTTVISGGHTKMAKGCISSSFCDVPDIPVLNKIFGRTTFACCEGDLCNAAHSHAGLSLLLPLPLACFSLFH